uniref:Coiled-coil domain-containing protein 22 n=1 Tax=Sinocyclocheilus rhinocerous TaxID=307959 RepID=A0A673G134_9TELE
MEEVDRILIHSLRQAGTDIDEDVQSVKQFTSELIVEAVVKCLRVIDPALGNGLSHSLPPGMSARFRLGMSLSQACQDVGFKGEIGYQTFLYSNEPEIRSLFMFLVEKLPRESADASDQPAGKSALLQRAIAAQIKAQLSVPWLPLSCSLPIHRKTQSSGPCHSFHAQPLSLPYSVKVSSRKQPKEVQEYWRNYLLPVTAQPSQHASVPASLLENHISELSATQEWESEWNSQGLLSRLTPEEYRSRKKARLQKRIEEQLRAAAQPRPDTHGATRSSSDLAELLQAFGGASTGGDVLTKGTRFTHTEKFTFTQVPVRICLLQLMGQGSHMLENLGFCNAVFQSWKISYMSWKIILQQKEVSNGEKENSIKMKRQTIDLLPDAENNLLTFQSLIEASSKRVVHLASQWEKHRLPLIDEHRRLKELCSNRESESSRKLSEIKDLHDKIRQSAEEAKKKESVYKQLLAEFETLSKDVSRSTYTMRILEIVGNIKKQKEEITKILSDTKDLQKEINGLTGKLDRTFAVTDELVFKDAKKDESVRKSYKYLAALHENCTQLIQTIEDTGTIMREIRDLEEQIETENGKRTVSNLEKILEDYKAIRQENSALAAKIREG